MKIAMTMVLCQQNLHKKEFASAKVTEMLIGSNSNVEPKSINGYILFSFILQKALKVRSYTSRIFQVRKCTRQVICTATLSLESLLQPLTSSSRQGSNFWTFCRCIWDILSVENDSIDGHIKFWKKMVEGISFVKHFKAHLGPINDLKAITTVLNLCAIHTVYNATESRYSLAITYLVVVGYEWWASFVLNIRR